MYEGVAAVTGRGVRWLWAGVVTLAVTAVTVVVCGVWLLPLWVTDGAIRWGLAGTLGLAVAALAALWGQGYATDGTDKPATAAGPVLAEGDRSVAFRGPVKGGITTGDTTVPPAAMDQAPGRKRRPAKGSLPGTDTKSGPGQVIASGERAVAVDGEVTGGISTGDRHDRGPQQ